MTTLAALGMIECGSLSVGSLVADAMLKTANVHLLLAHPVSPGKLLVAVEGSVADVEAAVASGLECCGDHLEDALFIPRLHPEVGGALLRPIEGLEVEALGLVETKTAAAGIRAADASLKAASVGLLSLRLSAGIGGKALYALSGSVADVQAAVEAGSAVVQPASLLVETVVIPQPHPDYARYLAAGPGVVGPPAGVQPPAEVD